MIDLSGKVALVTGSSRGIGRACVEAFAQAGARVIVSSRKSDACEPVAAALRAQGHEAIALPCHVGRKADVEALVAQAETAFGPIDILVGNAAVNPAYGSLRGLSDEAFDKIMTANVLAAMWLSNLLAPQMAKRGSGSIILISSIAGLRGTATIGGYGMSKAALNALARNLALEWGPSNIRVNAIAPGLIATDFSKVLLDDPVRKQRAEQHTPLRRVGQPHEIAGVALFLASDLASYITGQVIVADGGETIA